MMSTIRNIELLNYRDLRDTVHLFCEWGNKGKKGPGYTKQPVWSLSQTSLGYLVVPILVNLQGGKNCFFSDQIMKKKKIPEIPMQSCIKIPFWVKLRGHSPKLMCVQFDKWTEKTMYLSLNPKHRALQKLKPKGSSEFGLFVWTHKHSCLFQMLILKVPWISAFCFLPRSATLFLNGNRHPKNSSLGSVRVQGLSVWLTKTGMEYWSCMAEPSV